MKTCTATLLGLSIAIGPCLIGCGRVKPSIAARVEARDSQKTEQQQPKTPQRGPDYARMLDGVRSAYHVVLDNLANAQTPGYRAVRPIFETVHDEQTQGSAELLAPVMVTDLSPGRPVETKRSLDVAIQGAGYFVVDRPAAGGVDGLAYSRSGRLFVNRDNLLVLGSSDGPPLEPIVVLPDAVRDVRITKHGLIEGQATPEDGWHAFGMIHLARFANESALHAVDQGCFIASVESGPPMVDNPGGTGLGTLLQMHLEGSNVDVSRELTELEHLKSWGQTLAGALGTETGFRDAPPAAARWSAAPSPPAGGKRLTAATP